MDIDSAWEEDRENILPIRQGRSVHDVGVALLYPDHIQQQLNKFEMNLRMYKGDDPLQLWDEYILWAEQHFPSQGKGGIVYQLRKSCFRQLHNYKRYKNDIRFIKIFLRYLEHNPEPKDGYLFLVNEGYGVIYSIVFEAYANYLESVGDYKAVDEILQKGISLNAQPIDDLIKKHENFQIRMAHKAFSDQANNEATDFDGEYDHNHRKVLSDISTLGRDGQLPSHRASVYIQYKSDQQPQPTSIQRNGNKQVQVLEERIQSASSLPASSSRFTSIPDSEINVRENVRKPDKWSKAKLPQASGFSSIKPNSGFKIHIDQQMDQHDQLPKTVNFRALKSSKDSKIEPTQSLGVGDNCNWSQLFDGRKEFSFEEIMAERRKIKRAKNEAQKIEIEKSAVITIETKETAGDVNLTKTLDNYEITVQPEVHNEKINDVNLTFKSLDLIEKPNNSVNYLHEMKETLISKKIETVKSATSKRMEKGTPTVASAQDLTKITTSAIIGKSTASSTNFNSTDAVNKISSPGDNNPSCSSYIGGSNLKFNPLDLMKKTDISNFSIHSMDPMNKPVCANIEAPSVGLIKKSDCTNSMSTSVDLNKKPGGLNENLFLPSNNNPALDFIRSKVMQERAIVDESMTANFYQAMKCVQDIYQTTMTKNVTNYEVEKEIPCNNVEKQQIVDDLDSESLDVEKLKNISINDNEEIISGNINDSNIKLKNFRGNAITNMCDINNTDQENVKLYSNCVDKNQTLHENIRNANANNLDVKSLNNFKMFLDEDIVTSTERLTLEQVKEIKQLERDNNPNQYNLSSQEIDISRNCTNVIKNSENIADQNLKKFEIFRDDDNANLGFKKPNIQVFKPNKSTDKQNIKANNFEIFIDENVPSSQRFPIEQQKYIKTYNENDFGSLCNIDPIQNDNNFRSQKIGILKNSTDKILKFENVAFQNPKTIEIFKDNDIALTNPDFKQPNLKVFKARKSTEHKNNVQKLDNSEIFTNNDFFTSTQRFPTELLKKIKVIGEGGCGYTGDFENIANEYEKNNELDGVNLDMKKQNLQNFKVNKSIDSKNDNERSNYIEIFKNNDIVTSTERFPIEELKKLKVFGEHEFGYIDPNRYNGCYNNHDIGICRNLVSDLQHYENIAEKNNEFFNDKVEVNKKKQHLQDFEINDFKNAYDKSNNIGIFTNNDFVTSTERIPLEKLTKFKVFAERDISFIDPNHSKRGFKDQEIDISKKFVSNLQHFENESEKYEFCRDDVNLDKMLNHQVLKVSTNTDLKNIDEKSNYFDIFKDTDIVTSTEKIPLEKLKKIKVFEQHTTRSNYPNQRTSTFKYQGISENFTGNIQHSKNIDNDISTVRISKGDDNTFLIHDIKKQSPKVSKAFINTGNNNAIEKSSNFKIYSDKDNNNVTEKFPSELLDKIERFYGDDIGSISYIQSYSTNFNNNIQNTENNFNENQKRTEIFIDNNINASKNVDREKEHFQSSGEKDIDIILNQSMIFDENKFRSLNLIENKTLKSNKRFADDSLKQVQINSDINNTGSTIFDNKMINNCVGIEEQIKLFEDNNNMCKRVGGINPDDILVLDRNNISCHKISVADPNVDNFINDEAKIIFERTKNSATNDIENHNNTRIYFDNSESFAQENPKRSKILESQNPYNSNIAEKNTPEI